MHSKAEPDQRGSEPSRAASLVLDGASFPVNGDGAAAGLHNSNGSHAQTDANDIADLLEDRLIDRSRHLDVARKELQQARTILHELQKIENVGRLTGGIAHDFNNMLTVISGNIGLLERRLPPGEVELRLLASNAIKAVERAGALSQRLLDLLRRQRPEVRPVDVNRVILDMKDLLDRTLGETIIVETAVAHDLWPALVDEHQLENALLNLAVNARDAMPGGGRLMMETANAVIDESAAAMLNDVGAGDYVKIAVIDNGIGMTPQVLALAFEPFFTTKHVGEGTGLGLSQVQAFVAQSGGHVTVVSELEAGTAVTLYLPRVPLDMVVGARKEPVDESDGDGCGAVAGRGGETILIVEDDEAVRSTMAGILRDLGYRVLAASDGLSGLRTLARTPEIDLLFGDVGLPGSISGDALAAMAMKIRPGLKVLLTSGYVRVGVVEGDDGYGRRRPDLLAKPSTYAEVAAKIRAVLDCDA